MTCIIGLVDNGTVYMGGDSAGMAGWTQARIAEPKVQRVGDMLIGCTGVPRLGQIAGRLKLNVIRPDVTPFDYMVDVFITNLQAAVEAYKFDWFTDDAENSALMVGFKGELFTVCKDYSVNTHADGFYAMGQRDMALGAMAALDGMEPGARVLKALEIVGRYRGQCVRRTTWRASDMGKEATPSLDARLSNALIANFHTGPEIPTIYTSPEGLFRLKQTVQFASRHAIDMFDVETDVIGIFDGVLIYLDRTLGSGIIEVRAGERRYTFDTQEG